MKRDYLVRGTECSPDEFMSPRLIWFNIETFCMEFMQIVSRFFWSAGGPRMIKIVFFVIYFGTALRLVAKDHGKHSCSDYIMIIMIVAGSICDLKKKDHLRHIHTYRYLAPHRNSAWNFLGLGGVAWQWWCSHFTNFCPFICLNWSQIHSTGHTHHHHWHNVKTLMDRISEMG